MRWILTVFRAIAPSPLYLKSTSAIEAFIFSALILRKQQPYLLIAPGVLKYSIDLAKTRKRVEIIEKSILMFVALDFKVLSRSLGSTQLKPRFKTSVTRTGYQSKKTRTLVKSAIKIIIKKTILLTTATNITSQKTSIGPGNLQIFYWC